MKISPKFLVLIVIVTLIGSKLLAADFKTAFQQTLANEGGYANNSHDHGGETYCGVSRHFHPKWEGWVIVDSIKSKLGFRNTVDCSAKIRKALDKSLSQQKRLTELIEAFYKKEFWDPLNLDLEQDQMLANTEFDSAVLRGVASEKRTQRKVEEEMKAFK